MESSRLFGVKRGKQIASSNQLTSYLTKDSQNWFYKPSFSRKGITYCTFLWKHGTFQSCLKPLESEKYIFTDYYILYHTLLQIHWFGYIEEYLNFPKYCSIWSSLTRIFMIYESFSTTKYVLSNICLVYIENNCFVSKRGLSQVKKRAHHISDIQVTLRLAMISSTINLLKEIIELTFQTIQ